MKVLLSIKPKYVDKIISGEKKIEYRKKIFQKKNIDKILIYASSPVCCIVGEFQLGSILCESPSKLWLETQHIGGVDQHFFFSYFKGKEKGYGIEIKNLVVYKKPISLKELKLYITPPQSYRYIPDTLVF